MCLAWDAVQHVAPCSARPRREAGRSATFVAALVGGARGSGLPQRSCENRVGESDYASFSGHHQHLQQERHTVLSGEPQLVSHLSRAAAGSTFKEPLGSVSHVRLLPIRLPVQEAHASHSLALWRHGTAKQALHGPLRRMLEFGSPAPDSSGQCARQRHSTYSHCRGLPSQVRSGCCASPHQ